MYGIVKGYSVCRGSDKVDASLIDVKGKEVEVEIDLELFTLLLGRDIGVKDALSIDNLIQDIEKDQELEMYLSFKNQIREKFLEDKYKESRGNPRSLNKKDRERFFKLKDKI
ncbi:hypothetical protein GLW05_20915 [Pontibacillus yanchengensis]|uniref:Uncharacterized protein n=1 Tax=Pontibacillus yanchengensis TaxID=462910 RepID=A0A6I5A6N3_9BACI|nr:hypothetical protein [Pontibacillus yanchengensis]MYL36036.1 hypothetical protein [Pontibacillus yanchengensis]